MFVVSDVNLCSHRACVAYLYQTYMNFNKYVGVKCDNYGKYLRRDCDCNDTAVVGYNTSTKYVICFIGFNGRILFIRFFLRFRVRGTYYVDTESGSPSICNIRQKF